MSKTEYLWDSLETPPIIRPHSLKKHTIITEYLKKYIDKLYSNSRSYIRFSIVDGFAGGGIYRRDTDSSIVYGSPIKIIEAVNESAENLPEKYGKSVEIRPRYYFVEKNKNASCLLNQVLQELNYIPFGDKKSRIINGDILEHWHHIIDDIKSEGRTHRAIFILDQYGYKDVPIMYIQQLFKELPSAEVILTFAVDWLIDYLSDKPSQLDKCKRRLELLGVDTDIGDIVNIKRSSPAGRFLIQDLLSEELSQNCGARYFTRYFLKTSGNSSRDSHREIWLIHMSQHSVARDEMVKIHWNEANHISTHSGFKGISDKGMSRIGYSSKLDESTGQVNLDYDFSENSKSDSVKVLSNQLPSIVWKLGEKGPFTFKHLMDAIGNETPASSDIVKSVINYLLKSKDVKVTTPDGKTTRQKGNAIHWGDVIYPIQKSFFHQL